MLAARNILALVIVLLTGAACTPEPSPELLEAVAESPEASGPISADASASCRESLSSERLLEVAEPTYNPVATYKVAEVMMRSYKDGAQYAKRLRGYEVSHAFRGVLGQRAEFEVICFFEWTGDRLVYLENLGVQKDGRVSKNSLESAAASLYRKMSGKSRMDILGDEIRMQ